MADKNIVYKHLQILEESIDRIRDMDFTFDMVLGDEDIQDLLDRRMQKAIESAIDIAANIVAGEKLGQAETAGELFLLLGKKNILTKELAEKLAKAVGFRNILVHEYADIDYELAYRDLDSNLLDLEFFAKAVKKLIN